MLNTPGIGTEKTQFDILTLLKNEFEFTEVPTPSVLCSEGTKSSQITGDDILFLISKECVNKI